MISKVSFGSTYKVSSQNNDSEAFKKFSEIEKISCENAPEIVMLSESKADFSKGYPPVMQTEQTLIAPDIFDKEIETFCVNKGIKYKKLTTSELLDGNNILSRIDEAPAGMVKTSVNAEKLEECFKKYETNIEYCERDYKQYYKNEVSNMIKSGNKIPATTLSIHPFGTDTSDILNYIKKFGSDKLKKDSIGICFEQKTNGPDHCTYFVLKNMGVKNIPFYVDNDSYKIGKALELFN